MANNNQPSTAQHTSGPRKTYASGYLNNSTGKWNATAWSAAIARSAA